MARFRLAVPVPTFLAEHASLEKNINTYIACFVTLRTPTRKHTILLRMNNYSKTMFDFPLQNILYGKVASSGSAIVLPEQTGSAAYVRAMRDAFVYAPAVDFEHAGPDRHSVVVTEITMSSAHLPVRYMPNSNPEWHRSQHNPPLVYLTQGRHWPPRRTIAPALHPSAGCH
jgi:hypothetical protein